MAKYKSKTKQNYRKKSKGNGKKRRKSMKKRGGNGDDIFIKFLPDGEHQSLTGYSPYTDTDKIIAHLSLGKGDESKKVGDLRQFRCDTSKYIYLYLFDHDKKATELGDGSGCNYKFLNYNASGSGTDLSKFLKLIYYPETGGTKTAQLTLLKKENNVSQSSAHNTECGEEISLADGITATIIYEIMLDGEKNVGHIFTCTDDTNDGKQIKHDIAMINLTDLVPKEAEEKPQNWYYTPFETKPPVCPSTKYRKPVPLKQGTGICLLSGKHTYREVKIFTKDF